MCGAAALGTEISKIGIIVMGFCWLVLWAYSYIMTCDMRNLFTVHHHSVPCKCTVFSIPGVPNTPWSSSCSLMTTYTLTIKLKPKQVKSDFFFHSICRYTPGGKRSLQLWFSVFGCFLIGLGCLVGDVEQVLLYCFTVKTLLQKRKDALLHSETDTHSH